MQASRTVHEHDHEGGAGSKASSPLERYTSIRQSTERLCASLEIDDYLAQSMPDASPVKWHLAHTTWFFETFVLAHADAHHRAFHPEFRFLFNSYYESLGERVPRDKRGVLTRPTVAQVFDYRAHIDDAMGALLHRSTDPDLERRIELGLQHEQQHQELILTDLKHAFSQNPLRPAYTRQLTAVERPAETPILWHAYPEGIYEIGDRGAGFAFDNEGPRHRVYVSPFKLASRLVTNGDYLQFMADSGYKRPDLWLSDGWHLIHSHAIEAPLYWEKKHDTWWAMTLHGMGPIRENEPVCHVSFYEAAAYAAWVHTRLPTEAEWEIVADSKPVEGNFVESGYFAPLAAQTATTDGPRQLFGDTWEWTASAYTPYPQFRPLEGALGEYNGKFMYNQNVLRGGSCASPQLHLRATYRNFFPPSARWQFSGIRLVQDA